MAFGWLALSGTFLAPTDTAAVRSVAIAWAAWAVAVCVAIAYAVAPRVRGWWLVGTLNVAAVVVAADSDPAAWLGPMVAIDTWYLMAALVTAFMLRPGPAIAVLVGGGTTVFAIMAANAIMSGAAGAWREVIFVPVEGLAMGMAAVGVARALVLAAGADDAASEQSQSALMAERREAVRREESLRLEAIVHDGLINTLGAVAAGSGVDHVERTRARCRADVDGLRRFLDDRAGPVPGGETGWVARIITAAQERAAVLGIRLSAQRSGPDPELPESVGAALRAAVGEALTNVSKHAASSDAVLAVSAGHEWITVALFDSGDGFEGGRALPPASLRRHLAPVGIEVTARSQSDGAAVVMRWDAESIADRPAAAGESVSSLWVSARADMFRWLGAWVIGFLAIQTGLTVGIAPVWGSGVALCVLVGVAVLVLRLTRTGEAAPGWAAAVIAASSGIVAYLPGLGASGCERIGMAWWGAAGGLLCLLALVFMSTARWAAAGAVCYAVGFAAVALEMEAAGGGIGDDSCPPWVIVVVLLGGLMVLGVMIAFRRVTVHHWRLAAEHRIDALVTWQRAIVERERDRARHEEAASTLSDAIELVSGIGDGTLDPASTEVRERCAAEETYLRSLLLIRPDLDALGQILAASVRLGKQLGVAVAIESGEAVAQPSAEGLAALRAVLEGVVGSALAGTRVLLALFPAERGGSLTVICPSGSVPEARIARLVADASGELDAVAEAEGGEVLIELRWREAGSHVAASEPRGADEADEAIDAETARPSGPVPPPRTPGQGTMR